MSTDTQLELAINNSVDGYLNKMLTDMEKLLKNVPPKMLENAQLSNLRAVTQDTTSVEVVTNYIRYQMGRDEHARSWRRYAGEKPFGDALIAAIDGLKGPAESFVTDNSKGLTLTDKQRQDYLDRTWIALTRLYAGYLRRYLYYVNSKERQRD